MINDSITKKRIVILGAGFGGLRVAILLEKKLRGLGFLDRYEIVLIDKNEYHTYTPLLYEIATVAEGVSRKCDLRRLAAHKISELLYGHRIHFCRDSVLHVDVGEGMVHLTQEKYRFEFLVIALGSEVNFFGVPGAAENSFTFKTYDDAIRLRNKIVSEFKDGKARIVIGGAGATGVELAAEIKNWLTKTDVGVVEALPSVLFGFDERIVKKVLGRLKHFGIEVRANFKIKEVRKSSVVSDGGEEVPFDVFVWTGGVKAMALARDLPFRKERGDRIVIEGAMSCLPEGPDLKITGRVYALGDVSCIYGVGSRKPAPLLARVAIEQAEVVAKNVISEIKKEEGLIKKFLIYSFQLRKEYPYVVPVGGKFAVAKIGPFIFSGFLGWVLKGLVELRYLLSIMKPWRALRIWLTGLWVFVRNDNLG